VREAWGVPVTPSARAHREARFTSLYDANFRALLAYSLRRVDQPEDAADVVADTMLVAWRRLDDVPSGSQTRLWLFGVARRVLSNQHRSTDRRERLAERLRDQLSFAVMPDPADDVADVALADAALAQLSADDRELIQLTLWEGLPPRDIASVLGLPASTVRTRLHRARAQLRAGLGDVPGGAGHVRVGERMLAPEEGR